MILEKCFSQQKVIELCPEQIKYYQPYWAHTRHHNYRLLESHRHPIEEFIEPYLGLLRVSKGWNQLGEHDSDSTD